MRSLVFSLVVLAVSLSQAMTKEGVTFNDTLTYNDQKLVLNGLGVREATVLKLNVYVAGLYLNEKTKDASKIINSSESKVIKMEFVRDVTADKINGAWDEALKGKGFDEELGILKKAMKDVKEKDQMMYTFAPAGASFFINKEKLASFKNPEFNKALLAVWLGPKPPNEVLKSGMLGIE